MHVNHVKFLGYDKDVNGNLIINAKQAKTVRRIYRDFLSKKRAENTGQVPQYYVEESHPAIIEKDMGEAVQLEMERRRDYCLEHGIQKFECATINNPFAGRVICGTCGHIFGRKVWNSNDDRRRRIIWRCNDKYVVKGEKGCVTGILTMGFCTKRL